MAIWLGVNSLGESCTENYYHFHVGLYILGIAVIAWGLYLVSFRSQ